MPFILFGALGAWLLGARAAQNLASFDDRGRPMLADLFHDRGAAYALLFVLCALQIPDLCEHTGAQGFGAFIFWWIVVGALIGLTHYPAAFWVGCIGLATGIESALAQKRTGGFFAVGVASAVACVAADHCLLSTPIRCWAIAAALKKRPATIQNIPDTNDARPDRKAARLEPAFVLGVCRCRRLMGAA